MHCPQVGTKAWAHSNSHSNSLHNEQFSYIDLLITRLTFSTLKEYMKPNHWLSTGTHKDSPKVNLLIARLLRSLGFTLRLSSWQLKSMLMEWLQENHLTSSGSKSVSLVLLQYIQWKLTTGNTKDSYRNT